MRVTFNRRSAVAWTRDYFLRNPDASVSEAARDLKKAGMGLHQSEISRARQHARTLPPPPPTLESVLGGAPLKVVPKPVPKEATPMTEAPAAPKHEETAEKQTRVPKRSMYKTSGKRAVDNLPLFEVPAADMEAGKSVFTGKAVRAKWLNNLVERFPGFNPVDYQRALKEKFGMGIDVGYCYEVVRIARELQAATSPQPPAAQSAASAAPAQPQKPAVAPPPVQTALPPPPAPAPVVEAPKPFPLPTLPPAETLPVEAQEANMRAIAAHFRWLCERSGWADAHLTWDGRRVAASATLEL